MRDVVKDILVALLGAWLLERLPKLALAIVRLAARLMPTPELRDQMRDDWAADILTADGPLSMLFGAISIFFRVPSIRQGHGYPPFDAVKLRKIKLRLPNVDYRYESLMMLALTSCLLLLVTSLLVVEIFKLNILVFWFAVPLSAMPVFEVIKYHRSVKANERRRSGK